MKWFLYLHHYQVLNDPFCCMLLLINTLSLLLPTLRQRFKMLFNGKNNPKNCPFPWRDLDSYLICGSLSPGESAPQMAEWSVQPFLHSAFVTHTQIDRQKDTGMRQLWQQATSMQCVHAKRLNNNGGTLSCWNSSRWRCFSASLNSRHMRPIVAPIWQTDRCGFAAFTWNQICNKNNTK